MCLTFLDPMDCSMSGSSVHGIFQARVLEWGGTLYSDINLKPGDLDIQKPALVCSLVAQTVKRLPTMQETRVQSLGREDVLEKEMATHSSILAWKIPWMVEPGRLQSMGSQRDGLTEQHHFHFHVLEKEMATHSSTLPWKIPWTEEPSRL